MHKSALSGYERALTSAETVGNETVPAVLIVHHEGLEQQFGEQLGVIQCAEGYYGSNGNDDQCY